jgi:CRP/FNR family transcriptional regulator, cyclic AMP receptor protein
MATPLQKTNAKVMDVARVDVTGRIARTLLVLAKQSSAITHSDGTQLRTARQEIVRILRCSREMAGAEGFGAARANYGAHGKTIVVFGAR